MRCEFERGLGIRDSGLGKRRLRQLGALLVGGLFAVPAFAQAAAAPKLDSGDTAWMLVSSMLVLMMTIPGVALFYGGMVRAKNLLSVLMQCFAITALVSVLWIVYGYTLAFSAEGMHAGVIGWHSIIGGLDRAMLAGLTPDSHYQTVPESVFVMFQLTFAYLPMAHMVWSGPGSLLGDMGVLDFAGGTVVHINAGIAGLVACMVIGKRRGWPQAHMPPHNLGYTVIGASLLWLGWFGFNAGSAVAANGSAGMAMLVTQIAAAAAAIGWTAVEWAIHKRASVLGIASGAVAGLVAVTPAAGTCGPAGALLIGFAAGFVCFFTATRLKHRLGYDDTLDVFGVHAVAGIIGALLTGPFAAASLGGFGHVASAWGQLWIQAKGVGFTIVWSAVLSWAILKLLDLTIGLRVDAEQEQMGLDIAEHEERAYNLS